jgi:hypothetical protein
MFTLKKHLTCIHVLLRLVEYSYKTLLSSYEILRVSLLLILCFLSAMEWFYFLTFFQLELILSSKTWLLMILMFFVNFIFIRQLFKFYKHFTFYQQVFYHFFFICFWTLTYAYCNFPSFLQYINIHSFWFSCLSIKGLTRKMFLLL